MNSTTGAGENEDRKPSGSFSIEVNRMSIREGSKQEPRSASNVGKKPELRQKPEFDDHGGPLYNTQNTVPSQASIGGAAAEAVSAGNNNLKKPFKISKKTFSAMKRDLSDKKSQGRASITKLAKNKP